MAHAEAAGKIRVKAGNNMNKVSHSIHAPSAAQTPNLATESIEDTLRLPKPMMVVSEVKKQGMANLRNAACPAPFSPRIDGRTAPVRYKKSCSAATAVIMNSELESTSIG